MSALRVAFADPPYLGQARKHYAAEAAAAGRVAAEVNHLLLLAHLDTFDAWALCLSAPSLATILPLCPPDVRVGAWVKPFASFKPNVNPGYCWEPVIFRGGRSLGREVPTVRDYVSAPITLKRGVAGAKPAAFCRWVFAFLGLTPADEFCDLFPGSGAVSREWTAFCGERTLFDGQEPPARKQAAPSPALMDAFHHLLGGAAA